MTRSVLAERLREGSCHRKPEGVDAAGHTGLFLLERSHGYWETHSARLSSEDSILSTTIIASAVVQNWGHFGPAWKAMCGQALAKRQAFALALIRTHQGANCTHLGTMERPALLRDGPSTGQRCFGGDWAVECQAQRLRSLDLAPAQSSGMIQGQRPGGREGSCFYIRQLYK